MRSLLEKLGYRLGVGALIWRVPDAVSGEFAGLAASPEPDFLVAFVRDRGELANAAEKVAQRYRQGGHLWIAYPKKSGAIRSDLTRDHGWEPIAALGLLAVTQIAVDDDWSALRFRYRDEIKRLTRKSEAL